jgi:hypothetical protein
MLMARAFCITGRRTVRTDEGVLEMSHFSEELDPR